MRYIYRLLQLALRHMHVFQRWTTVWNMYLKKNLEICRLTFFALCIYSKPITTYYSNGMPPRVLWQRQNIIILYTTAKAADGQDAVLLI